MTTLYCLAKVVGDYYIKKRTTTTPHCPKVRTFRTGPICPLKREAAVNEALDQFLSSPSSVRHYVVIVQSWNANLSVQISNSSSLHKRNNAKSLTSLWRFRWRIIFKFKFCGRVVLGSATELFFLKGNPSSRQNNHQCINGRQNFRRKVKTDAQQKAYDTRYSQAVTHPSTNRSQPCLTSVIGRELVYSRWYGRRQGTWVQSTSYILHFSPLPPGRLFSPL